jgi:hypothetical protein
MILGDRSQCAIVLARESTFDLGIRTNMRMQRFSKKISESECLQACESCKAAEQAVGIIKVE